MNIEVKVLSEQLNNSFKESILKNSEIERIRDANLQLRGQIYGIGTDLFDKNEIIKMQGVRTQIQEYKKAEHESIQRDLNNLKEQTQDIKGEIVSRQRDIQHLQYFREKCAEMEMDYEQKLSSQKINYQTEIHKLHSDIQMLSDQIVDSAQINFQHENLIKDSNALQISIEHLENQNDLLQRTIKSYENKVEHLQNDLSTITFQYKELFHELDNLKEDLNTKDNKISNLAEQNQKLVGELNLQKKMCKCIGSSVRERIKMPVSQSLQRQLNQKNIEVNKISEELNTKCLEFQKKANYYVEERTRLTDKTTELFKENAKLKSRNTSLEESLFQKEEIVDRLKKNHKDISQRHLDYENELHNKRNIIDNLEQDKLRLKNSCDKLSERILILENKQAGDLNLIGRNNKQHENQIKLLRNEHENLKQKYEVIMKEKSSEILELKGKTAVAEGRQSAICDVLKSLQEELLQKNGRLCDLELCYQKSKQDHINLKSYCDEITQKYVNMNNQYAKVKEMCNNLLEFKKRTINTLVTAKKYKEECNERENMYQKKNQELTNNLKKMMQDKIQLLEKVHQYHNDSIILNNRIEELEDEYRRSSITPFHITYHPSNSSKVTKSKSEQIEQDPILYKINKITTKIVHSKKLWHQGLKQATTD